MNNEGRHTEEQLVETHLIQFSVVISGETHNPTILNPDFLAIRGIVPNEWGWDVVHVITTATLSVVGYANGVSITVEPNKLQIVDAGADVDESPLQSRASEMARRYVSTLPHVRYTAVGTNFLTAVEGPDPEAYLKDTFLKQGSWDNSSNPLSAVGLRLAYPLPSGRLFLSLDSGQAQRKDAQPGQLQDVLFVRANFHRECTEYPADKQIETYLTEVADDWKLYSNLLRDVLMVGD
jgi:hypothetical protein